MTPERRRILEPIWQSLDPESHGLLPFPPPGDDGDGAGDDEDLASLILYGAQRTGDPSWNSGGDTISETHILFAIRLGRALTRAEDGEVLDTFLRSRGGGRING